MMKKNILLLNANPKTNSLCKQLSDTYEIEAREQANILRFNLADMDFEPSLKSAYDEIQPLEPCLFDFQNAILSAQHLVIVSPIWWAGIPAKFKGLIDRALLPGFAFKYEADNPEPTPLLTGKTLRLMLTMDAPDDFAAEQAQPVLEQLDRFTFQYSGVSKAEYNLFGSVISAQESEINQWLQTAKNLGAQCR